jgi:glycosyl transferase family 25
MQSHFQYLNDYYDKIYVLSLARLRNRTENTKKNLAGLNFEFFEGTDKQTTSVTALKELGLYTTERYQQFYKNPTDMPLGMLCCSIGHVKIYEDIIRHGYKKTLIMEDDVIAIKDSLQFFPSIINELPDDWELLYLGYEKNENTGIKGKIKQFIYSIFPPYTKLNIERKMFSRYYPVKVSAHIARAGFHDCTHAYSVTLEGAKKILQHQQPVAFNPDNLLSVLVCSNQINGYISRPKLFNQLSAFVNKTESLTGD